MIEITIDEVIGQKVLLFDVLDKDGTKVFSAGEIMTPGKILVLKKHEALFKRDDDTAPISIQGVVLREKEADEDEEYPDEFDFEFPADFPTEEEASDEEDFTEEEMALINKYSKFEPKFQREIKENFQRFTRVLTENNYQTARENVISIRDKLVENVLDPLNETKYCSELKLLSEHFDCHSLNTAIYAICLARKMDYSTKAIQDVALSALLHDIGKLNIPFDYSHIPSLTKRELILYQAHTIHGYKIIKHKFKLPREIARVALEHHEQVDGNGYPYGISGTMMSEYAQIVAVADCYDHLSSGASGRDDVKFSSALRDLLKKGSKVFAPRPLYTFVHMFYYSDNVTMKDLKG